MDLSRPESAIIPALEGPLLKVLAGTNAPLTLTHIASLAGTGSISGARKALLRLVAQGVVAQVPGGYLLNRDHLATPAVLLLAGMRAELFHRICEQTNQWPHRPVLVGVFGSFARREGDANSDIDLLLVSEDQDAGEQASDLAERVQAWTGNECHVVALTPSDLARMRKRSEPILDEWDREVVVLVGDNEVLRGPG